MVLNLNGSRFHIQQTPGYKLGVLEQIFYLGIFLRTVSFKIALGRNRALRNRKISRLLNDSYDGTVELGD